jgi:hypothetical protein
MRKSRFYLVVLCSVVVLWCTKAGIMRIALATCGSSVAPQPMCNGKNSSCVSCYDTSMNAAQQNCGTDILYEDISPDYLDGKPGTTVTDGSTRVESCYTSKPCNPGNIVPFSPCAAWIIINICHIPDPTNRALWGVVCTPCSTGAPTLVNVTENIFQNCYDGY